MERKSYNTKHAQTVLHFIKEHRSDYITVTELLTVMAEAGHNIGQATLYRHLDRLVGEGVVRARKIEGVAGTCYQYCGEAGEQTLEHLYMKCEDCGRMVDLDCDHLEELYRHVQAEHHILLKPQKTLFYGVCDTCMNGHVVKEG